MLQRNISAMGSGMQAVGTLWIGDRLSFLEQLCLQSYVDQGQPITLYSYGKVAGVPHGVEPRDAREVMAGDRILRVRRGRAALRGSPALHADMFRLRMLAATDLIWADTDAYALRPLTTEDGWLIGQRRGRALNGVLRLPRTSHTLRLLVDGIDGKLILPGMRGDPESLRWGAAGPDALNLALELTGEDGHICDPDRLYPIPARDKLRLLEPGMAAMPPGAMSIHLWGTNLRAHLARNGGLPPRGSMLDLMCRMHGIVPRPEDAVPVMAA